MNSGTDRAVFVFIGPYEGRPPKWMGGLVETGRRLAADIQAHVEWVVFGLNEAAAADLFYGPATECIHLWPEGRLAGYDSKRFAQVLLPLLSRTPAPILLAADTPIAREVTSLLAGGGNSRLIPHCVELKVRGENIEAHRLVMGGQFERRAVMPLDKPLSVVMPPQRLPHVFDLKAGSRLPISIIEHIPAECSIEPLGLYPLNQNGPVLEEADIVVAGGWGAEDEAGFALLAALANALGASVAGSAVAAEQGWISRSQQIGRSGRMVFPDIFIACGISGSVHFTSGMDQSGLIVAVNTDPDAPIFKVADIRIVGDLRKVIPVLTDRIRERSRS